MSHQPHDIFENRKQFQLERMILFSDAVFAIAITLLVIEIRIPELHVDRTDAALKHAIAEKILEFLGLVMSFAVIGLFWVQHHRLFGMVTDFDNKLLWLNLFMLFWIILVPFSSSVNSHFVNLDFAWKMYSLNLFFIGISMYFLWNYIGKPSRKLSLLADDPVRRKYAKMRSLLVAFIFLMGFLLCLPGIILLSQIARFIFCLIFPVLVIITKKYNKVSSQKNNPT
ncbi:MAG: TMEM175 family protein [Sediminibacterium sp.]